MTDLNSEDLFLNRAKFVMKCLGVWTPPNKESSLSKTYRYFMIILQYIFLIFQIIYIVQLWGDLETVSEINLLFTQACLCFKITVFHVNINNLKKLLQQMNSPVFVPQNDVQKKIMIRQAGRIKRLMMGFMITSQATCVLWALIPLFDDVGSRKFPFCMWMPISPEYLFQYILGYSFQLLTLSFSAYMYFGVDSVALSTLIFACAQLDVIKEKIIHVTSVESHLKTKEREELFTQNHKKLIDCIIHYQAVFKLTKLLEDTYHSYLMFQITGCVGIFCMTAFRILVNDWRSVQFLTSIAYLCVMLSQLFLCCWCGHELTATSEDLHTVLYTCLWYEQSNSFKRDLCFAMMRMSRPMVFRAGHYISLSRETFIAILRMSYSYFAVLLNQTSNN